METLISISDQCPVIQISNDSTYDAGTSHAQDKFTDYVKLYVEDVDGVLEVIDGLAHQDTDWPNLVALDAPDIPDVLKITLVQLPTADLTLTLTYDSGDLVYDTQSGNVYKCSQNGVVFDPGQLYWTAQIELTGELSLNTFSAKYKAEIHHISICALADIFDGSLIEALEEAKCLGDDCCESIPCNPNTMKALKILVLAFDTYYVQGQLNFPDITTNLFKDSFKKNRDLLYKIHEV